MYPGDTRDIDVPVYTSCMFPADRIYTYAFSIGGVPISWVTYDSAQDKIVATVTQQSIDNACGTTLATFTNAYVQIDVTTTPTYNTQVSAQTLFFVHFENPRTVACKDTVLIAPSISQITTRVSFDPIIFDFPVMMDTASLALGDPTGLNCGQRTYTFHGWEGFIQQGSSDLEFII